MIFMGSIDIDGDGRFGVPFFSLNLAKVTQHTPPLRTTKVIAPLKTTKVKKGMENETEPTRKTNPVRCI